MSKIDLETAKSIARGVLSLPDDLSQPTKKQSAKTRTTTDDDLSLKLVAYAKRTVAESLQNPTKEINDEAGDPKFYMFAKKGSGCAFISAENVDNPILGFTDNDANHLNDIPPGLKNMMELWRLSADNSPSESSQAAKKRDIFTRGKGLPIIQVGVEPLIKTKWKQGSPYNYYCPVGYPSGCAAIAMAQVIRYYEWPKVGKGTHQYDDSASPCKDFTYNKPNEGSECPGLTVIPYQDASDSIKIDYEHTKYEYFHMPPQLLNNIDGKTNISEGQKWSAALVRHCATAVNMDFYKAGSHPDLGKEGGALNTKYIMGLEALHNYFRYKKSSENWHYKTGWANDVKKCLDGNRPVLFYSQNLLLDKSFDSRGMHIFLCDGYGYSDLNQKNILFHFNFGWGGNWDGYYAEGVVSPNKQYYNLTLYTCTNLKPDGEHYFTDVVFNIPDFKPVQYKSNQEGEDVDCPFFPYGKTPVMVGYDKEFRIDNRSVEINGLSYCIDAIRYGNIVTQIQSNTDRVIIPANHLSAIINKKVEVLLRPNYIFEVDGIGYKAINYYQVKAVKFNNKNVEIPKTITHKDLGLVYEVVGIDISKKNTTVTSIKANYFTQIGTEISLFSNLSSIELKSVKTIPDGAFRSLTELSSANISSATSIGNWAFDGCTKLKDLDIQSAEHIGDYAFQGCSSLLALNCNKLYSVGEGAFMNCKALISFSSERVTTLPKSLFEGCSKLSSFNVPNFKDENIADRVFAGCRQLTAISPTQFKKVGIESFSRCNLKHDMTLGDVSEMAFNTAFTDAEKPVTITFEATCKTLGAKAFLNCTAIECIYCLATTPPQCSENTFDGVPNSIPVYVPSQNLQQYRKAPGWKHFTNFCNMVITIDGVKYEVETSDTAKAVGCNSLWVLNTNNHVVGTINVETLDDNGRNLFKQAFGKTIFLNFLSSNNNFPQNIYTIQMLSCLIIKKYITYNNREFRVTSIASGAFKESLKCLSIYIEDSKVSSNAFAGCTDFKIIFVKAKTPPSVVANAFVSSKLNKNTMLIVPKDAVSAYEKDPVWKRFQIIGIGSCNISWILGLGKDVLEQEIKHEALQALLHDKYVGKFQDLEHLVNQFGRYIPQFIANKPSLGTAMSTIFDKINKDSTEVEIVLPEAIKGQLDELDARVSSSFLKEGIKSLGRVQLYASSDKIEHINNYIKSPKILPTSIVKLDRQELVKMRKDILASLGKIPGLTLPGKPIPGKPVKLDKSIEHIEPTELGQLGKPIRPDIYNTVVNLIYPASDYEEDLAYAAQQFYDLMQPALKE
jgi:hypothetical protein